MNMIFDSVVMGIIEGVTEFLPISSTGHLIIANQFIKFKEPFAQMFEILIQLGAILSVVVYFRNRLIPFGKEMNKEKREGVFNLWKKAVVGVIPAIIIGGTVGKIIQEQLFKPHIVAAALIAGGIILIAIESFKRKPTVESIAQLSYKMAVAIGFIQCFAMIPGVSRSAATIIGAMLLGASRNTAAEFSFFLAIPTMAAASGYSLLKHTSSLSRDEWTLLAVGFTVSFIVAWAVIAVFMNYIRKNDFKPFGYYRILLGLLVMFHYSKGGI